MKLFIHWQGLPNSRIYPTHLPISPSRQGGFGEEIDDYLRNIDLVIDATHPFATHISANIANACIKSNIPLLHYQRRWQISANWQMAKDNKEMMVMVKNHPQAKSYFSGIRG